MELKEYQERVLAEVRRFLEAVAVERANGNNKHAASDAWEALHLRGFYHPRRTGAGRDLPTICVKVPTGGGKTLLATQILGEAYRTILVDRNGSGLALWVVPSDQIYKDTLRALRDRGHFYRIALETAVSRRIEVWEKHEITRITSAQMAANLNILVLKLQGTNREDRESLKFFRDSGGNIVQHFPPEDNSEAHAELKKRIFNLETTGLDPLTGEFLVKTSIANLVRLSEPVVILDEGHKATSELARKTIEGFNATLVVELSATPQPDANVVTRVTGAELLAAEMIKLPINVLSSRHATWQYVLTQASEQREKLWMKALEHYESGNRLIRPIVLVQVERTGKDQIDHEHIHSEHVKEYLTGRLGIPRDRVAIKSSEKDDIEGIDLLDEDCKIEWIVTKAALQEGWDCPFAYILVSLSNTQALMSLTQLVGRVLRQPFVERTAIEELNESYVYCLRAQVESVVREVRHALAKEGYEGDAAGIVQSLEVGSETSGMIMAHMKPEFRRLYRQPFEGRIFLPRFCVQAPDSDKRSELDYFRHLLSAVELDAFDYNSAETWDFESELRNAHDRFYRIDLNEEALEPLNLRDVEAAGLSDDADTRSWLIANTGIDWYSAKQLRSIVDRICSRLDGVLGKLSIVRYSLIDRIRVFIQTETNKQTHARFERLYEERRLHFYLHCVECRFEIPAAVERRRIRALQHDPGHLQKDLFDFEPDDLNALERSVALYLDRHPEVLWWYRNAVGANEFAIRGWKPNAIYPDFIVQAGKDGEPRPKVWLVESKGGHLAGNTDTAYKRDIANWFDKIGEQVTWQQLGDGFDERCFSFQVLEQGEHTDFQWKDELEKLLTT